MVKNLNNTKIKVNDNTKLIIDTLRKNGYRNNVIGDCFTFIRYIYIIDDYFYTLYSETTYNRLTQREIILQELLENKIKRITLKQDTTASKKAEAPKKKYVTKNTQLVVKDWVVITETDDVAIINMISPNGVYYVVSVTGTNPGKTISVRKEAVERFKGSITIKA